jgi:hypothetical protein
MSSLNPSKALLMQHFLKDLTIMLYGMAFHAAETHRAKPAATLTAVMRLYRWQLRKWPLHTRRVTRVTVKALVTSNIIQSVCLVGQGRLKERCGLESRTFFFSFKKSAKTSAD